MRVGGDARDSVELPAVSIDILLLSGRRRRKVKWTHLDGEAVFEDDVVGVCHLIMYGQQTKLESLDIAKISLIAPRI